MSRAKAVHIFGFTPLFTFTNLSLMYIHMFSSSSFLVYGFCSGHQIHSSPNSKAKPNLKAGTNPLPWGSFCNSLSMRGGHRKIFRRLSANGRCCALTSPVGACFCIKTQPEAINSEPSPQDPSRIVAEHICKQHPERACSQPITTPAAAWAGGRDPETPAPAAGAAPGRDRKSVV